MKKNRTMRAAALLLVLTLMTSCFVGGTFAKYTSTATGTGNATVAKWSVKVGTTDIATTTPFTFDLFTTTNEFGGGAEDHVTAGKIAPGTQGSFDLVVENFSEVTAKYTITLTEDNTANIPLQYSLDGSNWVDSIGALTMSGLTDQILDIGVAAVTHTVYWRWAFEGGGHAGQTNADDTALGIAAATLSIEASITATQVD